MASDENTIRSNMDRLINEALSTKPGQENPLKSLFNAHLDAHLKGITEATNAANERAKFSGEKIDQPNPEEIYKEASTRARKELGDLAVSYASGNAPSGSNEQSNPLVAQAAQTAAGFVPFGGTLYNAASTFGIGNIIGSIGKFISVAFEWITQKTDANGNKKGFGEIWTEHTQKDGLNHLAHDLGVNDPNAATNFINELTKPVAATTTNAPASNQLPGAPPGVTPPLSTPVIRTSGAAQTPSGP